MLFSIIFAFVLDLSFVESIVKTLLFSIGILGINVPSFSSLESVIVNLPLFITVYPVSTLNPAKSKVTASSS